MSSEKANAIVLRVVEFSETSSICALFTREFGKVRGLAKGARRRKGPFESALDLLAQCRIVFLRKSSDALDLLTEAKLEKRFRPASGGLSSLYAGYYIAEILNEFTDDGDPHPELYDAAVTTLAALEEGGDVDHAALRFELTALRVLGHQPSLDRCVECGAEITTTHRVFFGQLVGGVICESCRHGKKQVVSVSPRVMQCLKQLSESVEASPPPVSNESFASAPLTAPIDPKVRGELRAIMNRYWTNLHGHPLKMHAYLNEGGAARPRAHRPIKHS